MLPFLPVIGSVVSGVVDIFKKKQETKKLVQTAKTKLELNKQSDETKIELTDAEGEAVLANGLNDSWKDEYVTIIITLPIPCIFVGAIYAAFTNEQTLLDGTIAGIEALTLLGLDWDFLTTAVVLSAIGLKIWRKA